MTRTRGPPEPEGDADSDDDAVEADGEADGDVHAASRAPTPRGPAAVRTVRRLTTFDTGIR